MTVQFDCVVVVDLHLLEQHSRCASPRSQSKHNSILVERFCPPLRRLGEGRTYFQPDRHNQLVRLRLVAVEIHIQFPVPNLESRFH